MDFVLKRSAGRIARQNALNAKPLHRDSGDSDSNDRDREATTARPLKQTHSSGAQRIVVPQSVKKVPTNATEVPKGVTLGSTTSSAENNTTTAVRQSHTRGQAKVLHSTESSHKSVSSSVESSVSVSHSQPLSHTVPEIRVLLQDAQWDKRVLGFEAINQRFVKWLHAFHDPDSGTSSFPPYLEEFLDSCIHHLSDSHHKVVGTVGTALDTLCRSRPNPLIAHRLSLLLSTLLTRLGDRKPSVRTQANALLDMIRESYDAPHVIAALSPRMAELPERTRITLVQFLISVIPFCESYFNMHSNMSAFLNRLVIVLGLGVGTFANNGQRASSALVIAGQRLLELLYNVSKDVSNRCLHVLLSMCIFFFA